MANLRQFRSAISGVPIIVGVMILLSSFGDIRQSYRASDWAVTDGRFLSEQLENGLSQSRRKSRNGTILSYLYEVNGVTYVNSKVGFGISKVNEKIWSGTLVNVYFDENNPSDAVLVVGIGLEHIVSLGSGAGFIFIGIVLW